MKKIVKIHEKYELKVRFPENVISQIAKMMKIREKKRLRIAIAKS